MSYQNVKELLTGATKLPAAIEGKLPAGAPKVSKFLSDTAGKLPDGPNFPMAVPDLPDVKLPTLPTPPNGTALRLGLKPTAKRGATAPVYEAVPKSNIGSRGNL